jgi:hypothetical protein
MTNICSGVNAIHVYDSQLEVGFPWLIPPRMLHGRECAHQVQLIYKSERTKPVDGTKPHITNPEADVSKLNSPLATISRANYRD